MIGVDTVMFFGLGVCVGFMLAQWVDYLQKKWDI